MKSCRIQNNIIRYIVYYIAINRKRVKFLIFSGTTGTKYEIKINITLLSVRKRNRYCVSKNNRRVVFLSPTCTYEFIVGRFK